MKPATKKRTAKKARAVRRTTVALPLRVKPEVRAEVERQAARAGIALTPFLVQIVTEKVMREAR